jgi:hypothetical protein
MDSTLKTLTAALEVIRDIAVDALNHIRHSQEEFDAMEMQIVSVSKAFCEGCSTGSRWQMPPMQKHRV